MCKKRIVVIGASGFVGAGIFEYLLKNKYDVYGIGRKSKPWRLEAELTSRYFNTREENLNQILNKIKPNVVINLAASGAYSFQKNFENMLNSNLKMLDEIAQWVIENNALLIHTGSSSEYGSNSAGPTELSVAKPNSLYSITKLAGTHLLDYYSAIGLKSIVLRLYSVYGPKEDPSRLIPAVVRGLTVGIWPSFTDPRISRDFIYLDDVSQLIIKILNSPITDSSELFEIYNVGSGSSTTIGDLKNLLITEFKMPSQENNIYPKREWDVENWFGNIEKVSKAFNWLPKTDLKEGLLKMKNWYLIGDNIKYLQSEYTEK